MELLTRAAERSELDGDEYHPLQMLRKVEIIERMCRAGGEAQAHTLLAGLITMLKEPEEPLFLVRGYLATGQKEEAAAILEAALGAENAPFAVLYFIYEGCGPIADIPTRLAEHGMTGLAIRVAGAMYRNQYFEDDVMPLARFEKILRDRGYAVTEADMRLFAGASSGAQK